MAYLKAEKLTKVYRRGSEETVALDAVSFSVEQGEMVGIVGRSGSGKSTLMHLLGCLDKPTAGQYWLNGRDMSTLPRRRLAAVRNREIGFVFQQFHLIGSLNAVENVELPLLYRGTPAKERRRRAEECLCRMGLQDRLNHKPSELSGGQQQRVAIARAMAGDPALFLADEPTGNLDAASATEVMECLHSLHQSGRTVLIITHDTALAETLPRRLLLAAGRLE
ncbi:MAG: ABC transporter ATP-binding protein [Ruminococcaceae bacterium]|nr:ABC transporter ATP-binding protein [Oscillospiraceae bacterium]